MSCFNRLLSLTFASVLQLCKLFSLLILSSALTIQLLLSHRHLCFHLNVFLCIVLRASLLLLSLLMPRCCLSSLPLTWPLFPLRSPCCSFSYSVLSISPLLLVFSCFITHCPRMALLCFLRTSRLYASTTQRCWWLRYARPPLSKHVITMTKKYASVLAWLLG